MQQFCAAIGRPELAARGLSQRPEDQQALKREIAIEFEKRDFSEWSDVFAALDACVEPMLSLSEAVSHPQIQARQLVTQVPRAGKPAQAQMACPIKFSQGLPPPKHIGAALGAHTTEVLTALGYSAEDIQRLKAGKVVA
jgi:crotonobetainyl-CoA:carnitine CoA-transferase CaiB-like acyl-CoA transferase